MSRHENLKALWRWWRRQRLRWRWRSSIEDQKDVIDTVIVLSVLQQLGDRPRRFLLEHCHVTLSPGIDDLEPVVFILSDHETGFDEPSGIPDLIDILTTFRRVRHVGSVIIQEPAKTMMALRVENEWTILIKQQPTP